MLLLLANLFAGTALLATSSSISQPPIYAIPCTKWTLPNFLVLHANGTLSDQPAVPRRVLYHATTPVGNPLHGR